MTRGTSRTRSHLRRFPNQPIIQQSLPTMMGGMVRVANAHGGEFYAKG